MIIVFKNAKLSLTCETEENCLKCQFTVMILCLTMRPRDSSQKNKSQSKTVRLGTSVIFDWSKCNSSKQVIAISKTFFVGPIKKTF